MRYHAHACIILLSIAAALFAADGPSDQPRSQAAVDAINALQAAKKRAQADYDAAIRTATARAVKALEQTKDAALVAKQLDEANRIAATIAELKTGEGVPLQTRIAGSKWLMNDGRSVFTYNADGTVICPQWAEKVPGHWRVINSRTIEQKEPSGFNILITFDDDISAALWNYQRVDSLKASRRIRS